MTYQASRKNIKSASSMNTVKHKPPGLSPLATAIKVAIVGVGLAAHNAGQAATIEVNSNLDNGNRCTLRDAITSINDGAIKPGCINTGAAFGTLDTINVAASVASDTVTLTTGELEIAPDTSVSINGNGVTVDANQLSGVIYANSATLSVDDMTIAGGSPSGILVVDSIVTINNSTLSGNHVGAAVKSNMQRYADREISILEFNNSVISNNLDWGVISLGEYRQYASIVARVNDSRISDNVMGGLYASYARGEVSNTVISNNSGSGVHSRNESGIFIKDSTISGNSTDSSGGGIRVDYNTSVKVENSTISDNSARNGGGVLVEARSEFIATNSTISNNKASLQGGGVFIPNEYYHPDVSFTNSTVSGNSALTGGGVSAGTSVIDIISSTISNNDGGGIEIGGSTLQDASVTLSNSIIAGSASGDCSIASGPFNQPKFDTDSASIIEDGSCGTNARAVDPLLLPLADNGCVVKHATPNGPACVMTHASASGSPAIDTAIDSNVDTDQIGTPRPQGGAADVGAFEFSSVVPTVPGFSVTVVDAVEGRDPKVVFTITLDEPQPVLAGYDFSTQAGSAIDGEDYVGRVGRLLFPAGETVLRRRIDVLEDGVSNEDDETFSLVVTDINNPAATLTTQATIRDGSLPELSVEVVKVRESSGPAVLTIKLSEPSTEEVKVDFSTVIPRGQFNPATGGVDFVERTGRITFAPGETEQVRRITIIDDTVKEANEVFRFELSKPSNAEIAPGNEQRRVFILNDD